MNSRQPWIDHKFNLGFDIGWTSNIMSRIKDTGLRIEYHTSKITDFHLSLKAENKWSIKEHIGHLIDLEELWSNRFLQFQNLVPELVHADMSNQKTEQALHNDKPIQVLLDEFNSERSKLISIYQTLSEPALNHQAFHPRIKSLMKPVDLLFFVAEHDNHHIVSINNLK